MVGIPKRRYLVAFVAASITIFLVLGAKIGLTSRCFRSPATSRPTSLNEHLSRGGTVEVGKPVDSPSECRSQSKETAVGLSDSESGHSPLDLVAVTGDASAVFERLYWKSEAAILDAIQQLLAGAPDEFFATGKCEMLLLPPRPLAHRVLGASAVIRLLGEMQRQRDAGRRRFIAQAIQIGVGGEVQEGSSARVETVAGLSEGLGSALGDLQDEEVSTKLLTAIPYISDEIEWNGALRDRIRSAMGDASRSGRVRRAAGHILADLVVRGDSDGLRVLRELSQDSSADTRELGMEELLRAAALSPIQPSLTAELWQSVLDLPQGLTTERTPSLAYAIAQFLTNRLKDDPSSILRALEAESPTVRAGALLTIGDESLSPIEVSRLVSLADVSGPGWARELAWIAMGRVALQQPEFAPAIRAAAAAKGDSDPDASVRAAINRTRRLAEGDFGCKR